MRSWLFLLLIVIGCSSDEIDRSSLAPDFGTPPADTGEDARVPADGSSVDDAGEDVADPLDAGDGEDPDLVEPDLPDVEEPPDVPEVDEPDAPDVPPPDAEDAADVADAEETEQDAAEVDDTPIELPATSWLQRSNLPKAVAAMSFTAHGGKLFAAGGFDETGAPSLSSYSYNITLDGWTVTNPMPIARAEPGAARLGPQLYTVGGTGSGGAQLNQLVRFNPGTGLWKLLQGNPDAGCCLAAAGVGDRLWAFGGRDGSDLVQSFLPAAGIWEEHEPMPVGRSRHALAVLGSQVVVIGGLTADQLVAGDLVSQVDVYDTETDTWSPGPDAPFERYDLAAATWEGQIWVFGGATSLIQPTADVWVLELGKGWVKAPTVMAKARRGHRAVATPEGIFVLGGYGTTGTPISNLDLLQLTE